MVGTVTPEQYDAMAAEYGKPEGVTHKEWTEIFSGLYADDKDLVEQFESIFRVLDTNKNEVLAVCVSFPDQSPHAQQTADAHGAFFIADETGRRVHDV